MDQYFAYTGTLEDTSKFFVGAVYFASNNALVQKIQVPKSGGVYPTSPLSFNLTFNDLTEGVGYIFRMWESVDDTATGTQRTSYSFTPRRSVVSVREDLQLRVGTTPSLNDGDTAYTDASLIGWNFRISKEGVGPFFFVDFWTRPTQDVVQLGTDLTFAIGEGYNLEFYPQIQFFDTIQSGMPTASRLITTDDALTYADANKYINTQGASTNIAISLPPISTLVEFQPFYLRSNGGNHINARYYCLGSDMIDFNGGTTEIVLGQSEYIAIYPEAGVFKLFGDTSGMDNAGQIIFSADKAEKKGVFADGSVESRKDYYRIWKRALANNQVVTLAQWNIQTNGIYVNRNKYHSGDLVNTFGLPQIYNTGYLKAVNGSTGAGGRLAGTIADWVLPDHRHVTTGDDDSTAVFGKTLIDRVRGVWGGNSSGKSALTSGPANSSGTLIPNVGLTNEVRNAGVYASIRS